MTEIDWKESTLIGWQYTNWKEGQLNSILSKHAAVFEDTLGTLIWNSRTKVLYNENHIICILSNAW